MRDPRTTLEQLLAPEVVRALDLYVRELAEEVADQRAIKPWLTVREAADALDCSPDAVRARVRRGRLRGRYQGRRLYIDSRSILDLGGHPADTLARHQLAPAARKRPRA